MLALLRSKSAATATMWAGSISLTVFWVANILKEAYPGIKSVFAFYTPTGPLLGLFLLSLAVFMVVMFTMTKLEDVTLKLSDKISFWVYVASVVLFFVMVFPPAFEPLVQSLAGK